MRRESSKSRLECLQVSVVVPVVEVLPKGLRGGVGRGPLGSGDRKGQCKTQQ